MKLCRVYQEQLFAITQNGKPWQTLSRCTCSCDKKDRRLTEHNLANALVDIVTDNQPPFTLYINTAWFVCTWDIVDKLGLKDIFGIEHLRNDSSSLDPVHKNFSPAWRIESRSGEILFKSDGYYAGTTKRYGQSDIRAFLTGTTIISVEGYNNEQGYSIIQSMTLDNGTKIDFTSSNNEAALEWGTK